MGREYTAEQIAEFEKHHGAEMVLVFSVGDDEYAFRRLSALDVEIALADKEAGNVNFHEQAAIRCVLTAEAPHAGKSGEDAKLSKDDLALLVKERERLVFEWKDAAMLRDMIGQALTAQCGWHWQISQKPIGAGAFELTAKIGSDYQKISGDCDPVRLTAHSWTDREYDEYRRLHSVGVEGEAECYAFGKLITSANKDEVARLHPYLVIGLGGYLQTLGVTKAVRLKKSKAGQVMPPGATTSTGGAATSP